MKTHTYICTLVVHTAQRTYSCRAWCNNSLSSRVLSALSVARSLISNQRLLYLQICWAMVEVETKFMVAYAHTYILPDVWSKLSKQLMYIHTFVCLYAHIYIYKFGKKIAYHCMRAISFQWKVRIIVNNKSCTKAIYQLSIHTHTYIYIYMHISLHLRYR